MDIQKLALLALTRRLTLQFLNVNISFGAERFSEREPVA